MSRDLFPYADDRATIERYLVRDLSRSWQFSVPAASELHNNRLVIAGGNLRMIDGATLLHYDTAGALIATIPNGSLEPMIVRAFNYALARMGVSAYGLIVRDTRLTLNAPRGDLLALHYIYNGAYIRTGDPFVLMGNMSMRAYRMSQNTTM